MIGELYDKNVLMDVALLGADPFLFLEVRGFLEGCNEIMQDRQHSKFEAAKDTLIAFKRIQLIVQSFT